MGWRFLIAMPVMATVSWWICTGLIGKKDAETAKLEVDCVRYINKALPAFLDEWKYSQWKSRASSELQLSVKLPKIERSFKTYKRTFGELIRIEKPVGKVEVDNTGGVPETCGYYTAHTRFANGSANIAMRLVKRGGGWKFQQFRVRSDMISSAE